jgi:hypothetical protein
VAEAEVLPHRHLRGAELGDQDVVDELLRPLGGERAVERDHHELAHAEAGDQVGLDLQRGQELGRGVRRDHLARVRLEGQDGVRAPDHLAVAEVDAVELPHRDMARAGLDIGEPGDLHQPRKPTTGLRVPSSRGSARAIRPSGIHEPHGPSDSPGDGHPMARAAGVVAVELDRRQEGERVVERHDPLRSASPRRTGRSPVRRSSRQ